MKALPGALSSHKLLTSMLRVNLAGEYGAQRIYEGQLTALKNHPVAPLLDHMKEQEVEHFKRFEEWVVKKRVRPTLLQPLWHVTGYALGLTTGLLGERAAMACTAAVEEVIDQHYENQLARLGEEEPELRDLLIACQEDEREHRDIALEKGPAYPLLSSAIKAASRFAIWASEKI